MMAVRITQLKWSLKFELTSFRKSFRSDSSKRWMSKYFLTTPIFYVNAEPHIGHLYTATIGDAIARYQKLKCSGTRVKYMVGTDEHGLKVSKSASSLGVNVKSFCDDVSAKYRSLFDLYSIEYDDFVRTTDEKHCQSAVALWNQLASQDLIYKEDYSGWYCVADEAFVSSQLIEPEDRDGVRYTLLDKKPVHYVTETNYKLKISKFHKDLLHWLDNGAVIKPKVFEGILRQWVTKEEGLSDISLSRPVERVSWGIPVPGDESQTMYVWFDALASYLSANGYPNSNFKWPPDVQIVGKDILWFHGVLWPIVLMACGLEPPRCILCHSHWLKDGEKISKSKGNVIDPFREAEKYTSDGFRYFLLREGVPHSDGNFTDGKAVALLNSELADTLGNLLSRCTGSVVNPDQVFPPFVEDDYKRFSTEHSANLMTALTELPETVALHFEEFNFYKGINAIVATLHLTNKYFDSEKPWVLRKSPESRSHLNVVLHLTMESLRVCGILLQPVVPNIADKLLGKLSIPRDRRTLSDVRPFSWESERVASDLTSEKVFLFDRIKATG